MKKEYDLKALKKRPGKVKSDPDAAKIPISLRLDGSTIAYFKSEAERLGMPYQTLVSSILYQYATGQLVEKKTVNFLKKAGDF
jgi:predicted DNA binding CopG/RHH family protein